MPSFSTNEYFMPSGCTSQDLARLPVGCALVGSVRITPLNIISMIRPDVVSLDRIEQAVCASEVVPQMSWPPLCLAGSTLNLLVTLALGVPLVLGVAALLAVPVAVAALPALVAALVAAAVAPPLPVVVAGALVAAGVLALPPQASSSVASAPRLSAPREACFNSERRLSSARKERRRALPRRLVSSSATISSSSHCAQPAAARTPDRHNGAAPWSRPYLSEIWLSGTSQDVALGTVGRHQTK